jgi:hypothetical protein
MLEIFLALFFAFASSWPARPAFKSCAEYAYREFGAEFIDSTGLGGP